MVLRLNVKQLKDMVNGIEANGGDATVLRRELETLEGEARRAPQKRRDPRAEEDEPTTEERLNHRVSDLFANGLSDELLAKLTELDRNHSLKELKTMCVGAGVSAGGDKKELAAKLVAKGIL